MKLLLPVFFLTLFLSGMPLEAAPEMLYLSDGQILVGEIIEEGDAELTIRTKYQTKKIPREYIIKRAGPSAEPAPPAEKPVAVPPAPVVMPRAPQLERIEETKKPAEAVIKKIDKPESARIITKDGKIMYGYLLYSDWEKIIYRGNTKSAPEITMKKTEIDNISIGRIPSEKVTVLSGRKEIISGDMVYNDDEKIILKRKVTVQDGDSGTKESEEEKIIYKKDIDRISYGEMYLAGPSVSLSAGGFFPLNTGGSELSPAFTGLLGFGLNLPLLDGLRFNAETGYSRSRGSMHDNIMLQRIPLSLGFSYPFNLQYFSIVPLIGGGLSMMFYRNAKNESFFGIKPHFTAGPGVYYELIPRELYAKLYLKYEITFDSGEQMHSLILSAGLEYRI